MLNKVYLALMVAALACFGVAALLTLGIRYSAPESAQAPASEIDGRFAQLELDGDESRRGGSAAGDFDSEDAEERAKPTSKAPGIQMQLGPVPSSAGGLQPMGGDGGRVRLGNTASATTAKPEFALMDEAFKAETRSKADASKTQGLIRGSLKKVTGEGEIAKVMAGDKLVIGKGSGGMGLRGTGSGGGGEGFGRVHGLGRIDTGGGRGPQAKLGGKKKRKTRRRAQNARLELLAEVADKSGEDGYFAQADDVAAVSEKTNEIDLAQVKDGVKSSFKYQTTVAGKRRPVGGQRFGAGPASVRDYKGKQRVETSEDDSLDSLLPLGNRARRAAAKPDDWLISAEALALPSAQAANQHQKPAGFLPRMAYFENTYLGRGADYRERLRALHAAFSANERPYADSVLPTQLIDAPTDAGLNLTATLSERGVSEPGRVFLQVALQGSERFGWRRPPLDVVLVVDGAVRASAPRAVAEAVQALLARLGPQDRLGIVDVGAQVRTTLAVSPLRVAQRIQDQTVRPMPGRARLADGLLRAGALLTEAAHGQARVPGTGTVLLLTRGGDEALVARAAAAAHTLSVQGAVTSVISLDDRAPWWRVAAAGHGNDHRGRRVVDAIEAELESLSKVIARLLRVNIRLGPNARAVRVLGSRVLRQDEVKQVKAREEATDRNLSRTMGVKADRGDDDDGLQTVIPFFHGGDAHVILVELWVDGPGAVADVTLKYKDMVKLSNATARASVRLEALTRGRAPAQIGVLRNLQGFLLAEAFADVAQSLRRGDASAAMDRLDTVVPVTRADGMVVAAFRQLLATDGRHADLSRALALAARSRISHAPLVARR
jgi:hypothetical protein